MVTETRSIDVLIVGAGMAGLIAASELRQSGLSVVVLEAEGRVGGRLASRRIDNAVFDTGAQFITARDPRFVAAIERWRAAGVVDAWFRRESRGGEEHVRWRGTLTMRSIADHLAGDLDVRLGRPVRLVRPHRTRWDAVSSDGQSTLARAVILTPPVPLSLALLEAGGYSLSPSGTDRLADIEYRRCIAVMAVLGGPSSVPEPGGLSPGDGPIGWIADNQTKGVSPVPAVTIHATADFSLDHWDDKPETSVRMLLEAAEPWIGSEVETFQVRRWRYSRVVPVEKSGCVVLSETPPLILAGDAFVGARVEGAALSGWAAADRLRQIGFVSG